MAKAHVASSHGQSCVGGIVWFDDRENMDDGGGSRHSHGMTVIHTTSSGSSTTASTSNCCFFLLLDVKMMIESSSINIEYTGNIFLGVAMVSRTWLSME